MSNDIDYKMKDVIQNEISKYCVIFFTPYLLRIKFGINNNKEKSS